MEKILELRQKRTALAEEVKTLLDKAGDENRNLTAEEKARYDKVMADITANREQESRYVTFASLETEMRAFGNSAPIKPVPGSTPVAEFKSFGEFLHTIANNRSDPRLKRAMGEGTDSSGGFLVPEEYQSGIELRAVERSVIRPLARKIPMRTDTLNYPAVDDTSHATSVYGGVIAYWIEEAGTKQTSQPKFRSIKLIAKKLTGFTYGSDELLADSAVPLSAMLTDLFGGAIAWFEDYAFINGNGVGQPLGIFNSGALIASITRATASQVALADLGKLMSRIYPNSLYGPSTVWIANSAVLPQLINLGNTIVTWVGNGSATQRIPTSLLGMPLLFTEKVPTLGTAGDIGLYDLNYYLIGDRGDLRIDQSNEYRFATDETTWRFVKRVDGQPLVDNTFTPKNGSTMSLFVQLSAATA